MDDDAVENKLCNIVIESDDDGATTDICSRNEKSSIDEEGISSHEAWLMYAAREEYIKKRDYNNRIQRRFLRYCSSPEVDQMPGICNKKSVEEFLICDKKNKHAETIRIQMRQSISADKMLSGIVFSEDNVFLLMKMLKSINDKFLLIHQNISNIIKSLENFSSKQESKQHLDADDLDNTIFKEQSRYILEECQNDNGGKYCDVISGVAGITDGLLVTNRDTKILKPLTDSEIATNFKQADFQSVLESVNDFPLETDHIQINPTLLDDRCLSTASAMESLNIHGKLYQK
ncbi:Large ribosomal subunit protein [Trichinella spiralis]|uniref:Large ribosomal subunit protein n=1 Tax=Trichinella spiralis TaxID=6334 RepID=A0ABR3KD59_TRISP